MTNKEIIAKLESDLEQLREWGKSVSKMTRITLEITLNTLLVAQERLMTYTHIV